jgi:Tol biopolymer transport system component
VTPRPAAYIILARPKRRNWKGFLLAPTFRLRFNALARLFALTPLGILAAGCGSGSSPPQPPVIGATSFSTNENQPLVTTLQFQDPQGQSMVASVAVQPAHGSLTVGSTLPAGTQLSAPILSPDGQRILMTVLTTAGIALYETTTAHPENLARISPVYPSDRVFAAFKYTQDSSAIVYTADSRAQGTFDIFLIQTDQPGTATQLNAPGSQSVFSPFFSLSPDGSTIAFAQPAVAGGPLALFLVDRSTPGLPFNAGTDVAPLSFGPAPFVIVPSRGYLGGADPSSHFAGL